LDLQKKSPKKEKNKLTEQRILTGKLGYFDGYDYTVKPLIERNPYIKKDKYFVNTFKDFILKRETNVPQCRFPGEKDMAPIPWVMK